MFKQILKITIFILLLISLTILIINEFLIKYHKLHISEDCVKYILHKRDKRYLERYSIEKNEIKENSIFYTKEQWSTKNNNYILFNDRYYIIEPGYYYHFNKDAKIFVNSKSKFYVKI